jgi:hypothetical protein
VPARGPGDWLLIGTPALILFPDGQLPGRLWRWSLRAYTATSAVWLTGQVIGAAAAIAGHQVHVDAAAASPTTRPGWPGSWPAPRGYSPSRSR